MIQRPGTGELNEVPPGFSAEAWAVVKRKPLARYADFTAGNRKMWRHLPNRDSSYYIYFDKEPKLEYIPDLLMEWRDIPLHFPNNFFEMGIFDPPHTWFGETSIFNKPCRGEGERAPSWMGNGGYREKLVRDIVVGQKAFSKLTPLLLFKWNETSIPLDRILSCFTEYKEVLRKKHLSPMKRGKADTWWVKFIRRTREIY